jgi:hypothetical protein
MTVSRRRRPSALFVLTSLIGLAAVAGLWQILRLDLISGRYETFAELEDSKSWQRGWVPDFVPHSATDIFEEHDIDTNGIYGEFSTPDFTPADVEGVRMLNSEERRQLLESLWTLGLRRRIGEQPVFRWCGDDQGMLVHFYIRPSGRVIYWGDADTDC